MKRSSLSEQGESLSWLFLNQFSELYAHWGHHVLGSTKGFLFMEPRAHRTTFDKLGDKREAEMKDEQKWRND